MVDFINGFCNKLYFTNQGTSTNSQHLVRCKSDNGRLSLLSRKVPAKRMDWRGSWSTHKLPGVACSKRESGLGQTWRHCQAAPGQQDCMCIHKEDRWDKKQTIKPRGLSAVERSYCKENNSALPSMAFIQSKHGSGFPQQKQLTSVGVSVIQRNLSISVGPLSCLPNSGCVRQQENTSAPEIHVMVPGSSSSGSECSNTSLGPGVLSVPPCPNDTEMSSQDNGGESGGLDDNSSLANVSVVASNPRAIGRTTLSSSPLQKYFDNGKPPGPTLPQPSSSCSSQTLGSTSCGEQELDLFLSNHLASGTKSGYGYAFGKFSTFCLGLKQSPATCGPDIIVKYLKHLFDSGCSYSSINIARCAISKHHQGFNGASAGCHKLVSMAVKSVFRQRPPLPKYKTTYDITIVLNHLKSLPNNSDLTLKLLSYKALFLLTIVTLSRMSTAARLGSNLLVCKVRYLLF